MCGIAGILSPRRRDVIYKMTVKLSDVVFRRTDLGAASCSSLKHLKAAAKIMADELGWDGNKQDMEINEALRTYSPLKVTEKAA